MAGWEVGKVGYEKLGMESVGNAEVQMCKSPGDQNGHAGLQREDCSISGSQNFRIAGLSSRTRSFHGWLAGILDVKMPCEEQGNVGVTGRGNAGNDAADAGQGNAVRGVAG